MARDNVIGKDNDMPWHLPADLQHFKTITDGKPVLMGRKTYESIGKPLPNRWNVIITRDTEYKVDGATVVHSAEEALDLVKHNSEIMVIGGASIYEHFLPIADILYVTHIDADIDGDTRFPIYQDKWIPYSVKARPSDDKNAYYMAFCEYERKPISI